MMIVAELSSNHNGKLENALKLCAAAKKAGVDAVKLQTYTPDSMSLDRKLRRQYKAQMTPRAWHAEIAEYCAHLDIEWFSTPFSCDDVDFLESLDCPRYKVASFEITDHALIRYIADTKKPIIISTGMATQTEITAALIIAQNCPVTLLKCTSTYPALPVHSNLLTMLDMAQRWPHIQVGFSDHSPGIGLALAAVALGASMIEKHFTIERAVPDAAFSLTPPEMEHLVCEARNISAALGRVCYGPASQEERSMLRYRRAIWVVRDIAAGEMITADHIAALRPVPERQDYLVPSWLPQLIGRQCHVDKKRGEPLYERDMGW